MSEIETGGPAFPIVGAIDGPTEIGMTLRDYFAAKAMGSVISHWVSLKTNGVNLNDPNPKMVAEMSYEFADAMLKVRAA